MKRNLLLLSYLPAYKEFPPPAPVPACFRQGSSYLCAYKAPNKTLFWSFYVSFCTFYASLRLIRTVFTRPKTCLPHEIAQRYLFVVIFVSKNLCNLLLKICAICGKNLCNLRLINDLRSTKDYVRKNNLFMQNKANFRKVKLNVTKVLTRDYVQMDTWSIRKTKPIQSQLKPIQSQLKPILCQNKPNSNPIKPNFTVQSC